MSYAVRFAPLAQEQIAAIEDYIALASGHAPTAVRYVEGIVAYCEGFAMFPRRGTRRDDLLPGLRMTNYRKRTLIAFRVDTIAQIVSIVGVFYGGQDYESAFDEPED